jgi:hypothetical protein
MPATSHRFEWLLSLALFGAILLALIIAAVLVDPFTANI